MSAQYIQIHSENPQARLISKAVEIIRQGGVIVYPTDTAYALGCHIGDKKALDRINQIRQLDDQHKFTLVCSDITEISNYAVVDNRAFRFIKAHAPGPYTFVLPATNDVPRRILHPKRKNIGLRIPDNRIVCEILQELGEPLLSSTLIMPGEDLPLSDMDDIRTRLSPLVDLIIDGGYCGMDMTTLLSFTSDEMVLLRQGKGETSFL